MKKNDIFYLSLTGIFSAIIILMTVIPQLGFILLAPLVSVTLLHIPVLIGVFMMPKKYGILLGLVFGVASFIRSFYPQGPLDYAFQNPLVSVLPRVLFALAAAYIFDLLKWINAKFKYGDVITFLLVTLVTVFGLYYGANALSLMVGWSMNWLSPIALGLGVIFLSLYYAFINSKDKTKVFFPSSLILSTVIHTILVLTALSIFATDLVESFFPDKSVVATIFAVAATNGLAEAIAATLIGTPILIALSNFKKFNQS
ncbi:MAG: ECF transporter S component [Acholeplasmataceae bacterium]|jgi:uncharacterized membrane protein|nr:ECF transporter S component [Acholeplasmataceae bacterium]